MAKKRNNNKGEVSAGLRSRLGEDLAQMFEAVGRKLYADLHRRLRTCIAEALVDNKSNLQDAIKEEFGRRGLSQADEHVAEWLDEVIGDSVYAVAEEVYDDVESLADAMLDEGGVDGGKEKKKEEEESEEDEESEEEEEEESEEEEEEKPEKEEKKAFTLSERRRIAGDLEDIKAYGLVLATWLANSGNPNALDSAALVRMAVRPL